MQTVWSDPAYESVARVLNARTGLAFGGGSSCSAAEAGTRRAMERAGVGDLREYLRLLQTGRVALSDLVEELTVCETYFFRNGSQFEQIRRSILPDIRQRRGCCHAIRAWSAACASGEEAYSLAIVFEQEGVAADCEILATDISRAALDCARAASYGARSLRGVDESVVRRYFHRSGQREILDDRIRRRVRLEYLNLAGDEYPAVRRGIWGMDLILCRNVLMYFDAQTIRSVSWRLFEALADGGWLITGASDPPIDREVPFESVISERGVLYRRPRRRVAARPPEPVRRSLGATLCQLGHGPGS